MLGRKGRTDGRTEERKDKWNKGRTDGRTGERTNGPKYDGVTYRGCGAAHANTPTKTWRKNKIMHAYANTPTNDLVHARIRAYANTPMNKMVHARISAYANTPTNKMVHACTSSCANTPTNKMVHATMRTHPRIRWYTHVHAHVLTR